VAEVLVLLSGFVKYLSPHVWGDNATVAVWL
jgi:hypothetical protein